MGWIQLERRSTDAIMITKCIPIPNRGYYVQRSCGNNINRFIPTRVEVAVDDSSLCESLLILATKNYIWIAKAISVTCFEVLRLDDLDGEDIFLNLLLPLHWWSRMLLDDFCASININLTL